MMQSGGRAASPPSEQRDSLQQGNRGDQRSASKSQKWEDNHQHHQDAPSRHLWVGNLAHDTPEAMVRHKFERYGELESLTVYPQRNYAFVNFRRREDAENAKEALHETSIANSPIRIEFAKGARPNRQVLVTGIAPSVTRDMLIDEFQRHGAVDDFRFVREKHCAYVDFAKTEDAITAVASLNGKLLGDEQLRVDYRNPTINKRAASSAPRGGFASGHHREDPSSGVLWIGFSNNGKVDDETLRRKFSPFGEVIRIKSFDNRSYCFVEYRSHHEATAAKNALSGTSINGLRVNIEYSTSEVGSVEDGHHDPSGKNRRLSPERSPLQHAQFLRSRSRSESPLDLQPAPVGNAVIAKAGVVVCQVQTFNRAGKANLPDHVVNCTAQTGLDILAKKMYMLQYALVYFAPVRSVDYQAYDEFINHLSDKKQSAVARLNDGSTIFLVPPSPLSLELSQQVIPFPQSEHLFGVLVHPPQAPPGYPQLPPGYAQTPQTMIPPAVNGTDARTGWLPPALPQMQQGPDQQGPFGFSNPPPFATSEAGPPPPPLPHLDPAQLAQLAAVFNQQQQQQQPQRELPPQQQQQQQQQQQGVSWPAQPLVDVMDPAMIARTVEFAKKILNQQQ